MNTKAVVSGYKPHITALLTAVVMSACGGGSSSAPEPQNQPSVNLKPTNSQQEVVEYIRNGFKTINTQDTSSIKYYTETRDDSGDNVSAPTSTDNSSFTGTNLQVDGVDEADVWKYNGEHFFVSGHDHVSVWSNGDAPQEVTTIPLQNQVDELYLHEDSLLTLSGTPQYYVWYDALSWESGNIHINSFDVANIDADTAPSSNWDIEIEGYIVGSRRVGDTLFVVSRFTPELDGFVYWPVEEAQTTENARLIDEASFETLTPQLTINGQSQPLLSGDSCYLLEDEQDGYTTLTSISQVDINTGEVETQCIVGAVQGMYMTTNQLYLFNTTHDQYTIEPAILGLATNITEGQPQTHIHGFSLGETSGYLGSGVTVGQLHCDEKSFCLGELADGSLGVMTSSFEEMDYHHRLTVFELNDNGYEVKSTLPNNDQPARIGKPGELLYSARFMQNRLYLVTFAKVDPLYVIDLSDSSNPVVAGELEIPGYSDYLHPIGSDYVIGVGKDAVVGASGTTWYQGVKVGLYDVRDMSNPTELASQIIGKRGSSTPVEWTHHAFTGQQLEEIYRFAIPVSVRDGEPQDTYSDPESAFYPWSHSGLYKFEVDTASAMPSMTMLPAFITPHTEQRSWEGPIYSNRSLFEENRVYYLEHDSIYSAEW